MGIKEYIQVMAVLDGAIDTLDQINTSKIDPEALDYLYNKFTKLKREIEQEAKEVISREIIISDRKEKGMVS